MLSSSSRDSASRTSQPISARSGGASPRASSSEPPRPSSSQSTSPIHSAPPAACRVSARREKTCSPLAGGENRRQPSPNAGRAVARPRANDDPRRCENCAADRQQRLVEPDAGKRRDETAEREQLRPLAQVAGARQVWDVVRRGRAAKLLLLLGRQRRVRVLSALEGDERLRDRRVELRADVRLDLRERLLDAQAGPVRPVGAHRVEAVGDDQEVRRERELRGGEPVVARSVEALVVVLDRPGLGRRELEAAQDPRGEPRCSAHRAPLVGGQPPALAQHGRVDRDLAEVVEARRPAEPVDVAVGQPERPGEVVHVAGDPHGVAVGRGMALVDDVREGLERVERLLARPADPRVRLVDGYRHGNDRERVPRVVERGEREQGAQARLGGGGAEVGLEDLEPPTTWSNPRATSR